MRRAMILDICSILLLTISAHCLAFPIKLYFGSWPAGTSMSWSQVWDLYWHYYIIGPVAVFGLIICIKKQF